MLQQLCSYCYVPNEICICEGMENYTEMKLLGQKICALKLTSNEFVLIYVLITGMFSHFRNNTKCYRNFRLCHLLGEK